MKTLIAGTFDNFHVGHQWLIWQASLPELEIKNYELKIKEALIIIIARDKTVKRIKGQRPKNTEQQRLRRVQQEIIGFPNISAQLGHPEGDFWHTIADTAPDKILLGYDQHVQESDILAHFPHIQLERCPAYQPEIFKSSKF